MKRIGIVAAGAVSCLGPGWRGLGQALQRPPERQLVAGLATSHPGTLGLQVGPIGVEALPVAFKQRRLMSRPAELAAVATRRCLLEAGWAERRETIGLFLGVGAACGSMADLEAVARVSVVDHQVSMERLGREGLRAASPLGTFHTLNNFTLCHAAIIEGLGGPNGVFYSRGGGTVAALAEACLALDTGACDRALAGGADCAVHAIVWEKLSAEGWPERGLVPAEGAAVLALALAGDALAWIEGCELCGAGTDPRSLPWSAASTGADLVVVAAADAELRRSMARRAAAGAPAGVEVLDATEALGEAPAATPALALAAALDLLVSTERERALVLTVGMDGLLGAVTLATRPATVAAAAAPRAVVGTGRAHAPAVITGVGVVSAFGLGAAPMLDGLAAGQSRVGPIRSFDTSASPVRVAAEVPAAPLEPAHLGEELRRLGGLPLEDRARRLVGAWHRQGVLRDRKVVFALLAAAEAWRGAGCGPAERRAALCLGLGLEHPWPQDYAHIFDGQQLDFSRCRGLPRERLRGRVDLAAACVADLLALGGPRIVNASACAAGSLAVGQAAAMVERGEAEVVLCGAADSMVNPLAIGGFWSLGVPSPRAAPDACRPFDRRRDGLVIGEGAALFVVESAARARARGARPLAAVLGWGSSEDGYRPTAPRPDGAAAGRAMRAAMARAGVDATRIGWVNAHGTGTPLGDPAECRAIHTALGAHADAVAVSSIKGAVGHLMAAAGAIELASCLLAFERGLLPGTAHLHRPDPACDLDIIGPAPRAAAIDVVMSNSFGFGGQNAAIILGRTA